MVYILPIAWVLFAALIQNGGMTRREKVLGEERRRATWVYALVMMTPIILLAAFRSNYFGDTFQYIRSFQSIPDSLDGKLQYIRTANKDTGFYALGALLSVVVGRHFRYYFLILAAIQGFSLMKIYRKYSEDYWFSIFVFVATTDVYSWMYNGIRQFTAVTIIFAASAWIFEKKYIRSILAICFASLFHQSALLMIPIVFMVQGKPWNWKLLAALLGAVFVMNASQSFTVMLDSLLQETQYSNMVGDWTRWGDDGTNPLRVLVYSVPTILSLFCRKRIIRSQDRVVWVACNMSIISTVLYLVSMVTSGIFMGRLPIYCSLYATGILLPWELKHIFGKGMKGLAVICFLVFYYIQLRFTWGML